MPLPIRGPIASRPVKPPMSALARFRRSPLYQAILSSLRSGNATGSTPLVQAESMIDYVLRGGDPDNVFRVVAEDEILVETVDDFADAVIATLVKQGFDKDLAEVVTRGRKLLLYIEAGTKLKMFRLRSVLIDLAKVELVATPDENLKFGTYIYKLSPLRNIDSYTRDVALVAKAVTRDKTGKQESKEAMMRFVRLEEHDHEIGQRVFFWDSNTKKPMSGVVLDIENYGTDNERYIVREFDGTLHSKYNSGLYASRRAAFKANAPYKPEPLPVTVVGKPKRKHESAARGLVRRLVETNPSIKAGDEIIDVERRKPFTVSRVLSNSAVDVRYAGERESMQVDKDAIERKILTGSAVRLRSKTEAARFSYCPNCRTRLAESSGSLLHCAQCSYSVSMTE